jgi:hypothetical protein
MQLGERLAPLTQGASRTVWRETMWRIVCYAKPGRLEQTLSALAGLVDSVETPVPVANATIKNGKLQARTSGTTLCELLIEHLKKTETSEINNLYIRHWMKGMGKAPSSSPYILKCILKAGAVKRHPKKKGVYVTTFKKGGK